MIYHGWPKLTNLGGTIEGFSGMGIPAPAIAAIFATLVEVVGGFLVLVGAFADIAGLMFAIEMLGAIIFVHAKNGFSASEGGVEFPLALLAMALAIALAGPGDARRVRTFTFIGGRLQVKFQASQSALDMIRRTLQSA